MILSEKRKVRQAVRSEIAKLSAEEKAVISSQIFSKIASFKEIESAKVVAIFVSLSDEPQTADFIAQLSHHKRVVIPRIAGDEMDFYDISDGVTTGAFGIIEPVAATPIKPNEIDVMIVPGVAFTHLGTRLGRGKGFYDKYLSHKDFRAYTIGVCYPCQLIETLPFEKHDRILDLIISI